MPFTFKSTKFPEVVLVRPTIITDERGKFTKVFNTDEFSKNGIDQPFVEDSISISKRNVIRGLHYQLSPHLEGKLVVILKGKIFDVVVDLRRGSPNFGKHINMVLCGKTIDAVWVPPGFAHGYATLQKDTCVMYKMTTHYFADKQRGIIWNDPKLSIKWPVKDPILSKRDRKFPTLDNAELNFDYNTG